MKINGAEVTLPDDTTLLDYLEQNQYKLERIAVEYNGEILSRDQYETVVLQSADVIEIVSFVGGG
ncbi:MAG: sulfur carrier protein ThiS [Peptococcaceae bacterium]|nr:sulfur carrier protein ThiS [Peptococcaceae bacterium]